jgi:hypothetical protein
LGPWKNGPAVSATQVCAADVSTGDLTALYHFEPPNEDFDNYGAGSLFIESLPGYSPSPSELFEGVDTEDVWRMLEPEGSKHAQFRFGQGETIGAVKQRLAAELQLDSLSLRVVVNEHEIPDPDVSITAALTKPTPATTAGSSMEYAQLEAADFVLVAAPSQPLDQPAQFSLAQMQLQIRAMQQQMERQESASQRQQQIISDQHSENQQLRESMANVHFETDKKNRTRIQRACRLFIARRQDVKSRSSVQIQTAARRFVAMRHYQHLRSSAAILVQATYRGHAVRTALASQVGEFAMVAACFDASCGCGPCPGIHGAFYPTHRSWCGYTQSYPPSPHFCDSTGGACAHVY